MRYSRMEERPAPKKSEGHKGWAFLVILIAIGIAVYFIGAAKVGDFVSRNVVEPVLQAFSSGEETVTQNSPVPSETAKEVDFSADEFKLYALQAGVFSDNENAEKFADEIASKGGAGYAAEVDGSWRVFIAGYTSKDDASNVKERLFKEQNMDTSVFELSAGKISKKISADSETAALMENADINGYITVLTELSLSKDKGEKTAEEVNEELSAKASEAKAVLSRLESAGDDEFTSALIKYYAAVTEAIEDTMAAQGEVELSSSLKRAYLLVTQARAELSSAV